jgi:hypothetical protein
MDMPDLCSTAIMEAKKWLKEKKLTNSKSELDHGTCTLNSVMVPPVSNSFIWSLSGGCVVCSHIYCYYIVLDLGVLIRNI